MKKDPHITDADFGAGDTPEQTKKQVRFHPDNYWTLRNKLICVTTVGSALSLCLSMFSLYVASNVAYTNSKTQRELREEDYKIQQKFGEKEFERQRLLKELDLRQNCQNRYDDLAYETKARVKSTNDAKGYYKRFWDLQFEQYQYCKDGLINREIFATWMASRHDEYKDNESVGKMPYQDGWNYMAGHFKKHNHEAYAEFVDFMNQVFLGNKATCELRPKVGG